MSDIVLSDGERAALEHLVTAGAIFAKDIGFPERWDYIRLKNLGFAKMDLPDPNFLYLLPNDRQEAYQFKVTGTGYNEYLRLKQIRDERERQEAKQAAQRVEDRAHADQNAKQQFKHDWRIAIFNAISSFALGAIADHFFDIVGNASRLFLALKHVFHS